MVIIQFKETLKKQLKINLLFCQLGSIFSFLPLKARKKFKNLRDLRFLVKTLYINCHLLSQGGSGEVMESEYLKIKKNNLYYFPEQVATAWLDGIISSGVIFTIARQLITLLDSLNHQKVIFQLNQSMLSNTHTYWTCFYLVDLIKILIFIIANISVRHCFKCFTYVTSFSPHNNPGSQALLSTPLYRCGN